METVTFCTWQKEVDMPHFGLGATNTFSFPPQILANITYKTRTMEFNRIGLIRESILSQVG